MFLCDYRRIVGEALIESSATVANTVVTHQLDLLDDMPAAAVADLFVRAREDQASARIASESDEKLAEDLLKME